MKLNCLIVDDERLAITVLEAHIANIPSLVVGGACANAFSAMEREEAAIVEAEGFIYFRAERKMIKVKYDEIIYIESMKDYIKIVRVNEKPLLVKQSISSLEDVLPPNLFLRIHRSYIVALDKIVAFTNHDVEIGGKELPIGRLYAQQVIKIPGN